MRYLDPKNDVTFKRVFGEHPHLLLSFLNALLPLPPGQEIVSLEYLTPELVPQIPILKNSTVDVRCCDARNRHFIVEMQVLWTDSFYKRVLFNASKAYVKQLRTGQDYHFLQPVYSLNLVDDTFSPKGEMDYYHHYQIVNLANTERQIEGLEFVFVELPKFRPKTPEEKKLRVLWLRYLTEIKDRESDISQDLLDNSEIREAIEYLQESAFSLGELDAYDGYWDRVALERTRKTDSLVQGEHVGFVKGLEKGLEKGEQIGLEKGEQIGLEKGKQIGLEEGEQIGREKELELVRQRMLAKGFTEAEIQGILKE